MIDDEDADLILWAWPSGGWLWTLLGLIVAGIFYWVAASNSDDCSKKTCPHPGETARLMSHECVCVSSPKD
jgi:hypothetical protein